VQYTPEDQAARAPEREIETAARDGRSADVRWHVRKDGSRLFVSGTLIALRSREGKLLGFSKVMQDITQKKIAEDALRESEERLQRVFEQAPVAIAVVRGPDFVVEMANPTYQSLLNGREAVGRRLADVVPDLGADVWAAFDKVMQTGKPFVRDGFFIPYDRDGDGVAEDYWFNVLYHPLRERDGTVSGLVHVCTEVTAQVRARQELERVNQGLEEFAHVASHDLQEPLRMVLSYSQLLVRRMGSTATPEQKEYARFIQQGAKRMEQRVQDLLTYSRTAYRADDDHAEANLEEALGQALSQVESRIAETGAEVAWDWLPVVRGDPGQISHVFQNLLANALKYHRAGVVPRVQVSATRHEGEWVIAVRDNGVGFEPEQAERIFGLFKRLHRDDEVPGSGLGLAICKRIVERHGGRIWAESEPNTGSTFYFSLPAVRG
jgi:PAS domain S-box-containing protein